jgi:hypothetical protein
MLFHHLIRERGDTYLLPMLLSIDDRGRLDSFLLALRRVIARHDFLRTAVLWEGFERAVQVVYRHAELPVEEITLDPSREAMAQVQELMHPEGLQIDLRRAPLLRI